MATGALVALAMPVLSADGAVRAGRSIEVFTESDLVMLAGYPPSTKVRVEVLRHGFVVGSATKSTDFAGGIEINHVGGLAGDCFEMPSSPDIQPSDTIRATVLGSGGAPDTSVVRGVSIAGVEFGTTTITVSGHVELTGPGAVDPATDVLELRINKETDWDGIGRSDLREPIGDSVDPLTGDWVHVLTVSESDAAEAELESDTVLEWSDGSLSELTIAEAGEPEPLEGCPPPPSDPTAPQLLEEQDSGKAADHVTNQTTDLTFSGLAGTGVTGARGPGEPVTLQVDGQEVASSTADDNGVYQFTGIDLQARATPHTVRVISFLGDAPRLVTVDTSAPGVRVRRFAPDPLSLTGREQLRAVYNVREAATLQARIVHVASAGTVRTFPGRSTNAAGLTEYTWNGKNQAGRDVDPGRYRLVLELTDQAGNVSFQRDGVRVTR